MAQIISAHLLLPVGYVKQQLHALLLSATATLLCWIECAEAFQCSIPLSTAETSWQQPAGVRLCRPNGYATDDSTDPGSGGSVSLDLKTTQPSQAGWAQVIL